jgi:hypothetical protein
MTTTPRPATSRNQPESEIQARILLAIGSHPEVRVFRNTVGEGWQGQVVARNSGTVRLQPGDIVIRGARAVTFGLCPGSSDIIGWRSKLVTPDMVGKRAAVFTAVEVKTPTGRASLGQEKFIAAVGRGGGIAGIARSPDEASSLLCI